LNNSATSLVFASNGTFLIRSLLEFIGSLDFAVVFLDVNTVSVLSSVRLERLKEEEKKKSMRKRIEINYSMEFLPLVQCRDHLDSSFATLSKQ